jgi:hypothetical protein
MKYRTTFAFPHRHSGESRNPATFALPAKALDPSFRWDDGDNTTPPEDTRA